MVMTGGTDMKYSTYIGDDNKYLNGIGESRGIIIFILIFFSIKIQFY